MSWLKRKVAKEIVKVVSTNGFSWRLQSFVSLAPLTLSPSVNHTTSKTQVGVTLTPFNQHEHLGRYVKGQSRARRPAGA